MDKKGKRAQVSQSTVQVFTDLVEMRFKPTNQKGTQATSKTYTKTSEDGFDLAYTYDPLSMVHISNRKEEKLQERRLKFAVNLSSEHCLIGNQNQLDMIGFGVIAHTFVDTDYYWSLNMQGPIENVVVDIKHSIFLILSQSKIFFFRYNLKSRTAPSSIAEIVIKSGVRFVRFLRDILLGVFYDTHYEIYNVENVPVVRKKLEKTFNIDPSCRLLTIPPAIDNIINIFFEEPKENKQSFVLWCMELVFDGERINAQTPYRVYNIMNYAKGRLSIQSYTRDIIFMNLKNQIMAIKNGYLIDTVNVTQTEDGGGILRYLHPNTILHITKRVVEVYSFSIDMSVKPEKIILKSTDAIELKNVPEGAFFISVMECFQHQFAVFYEDSLKKHLQSKGQISYFFYLSKHTSLKEKINMLFESIASGAASSQDVEEKYTVAKKMGLTEKEIYIEIWNRSTRCTIEDYQYILATRDYKIIKGQIQKKLKKESMVLRQILRLEEGCIEINKQKIESSTCSQEDLQDYVISHFLRKKLRLFKDISVVDRFSSIMMTSEEGGVEVENMKGMSLKMNIQEYYHFKDMQIKSFLVEEITDMLFNFKNNAKTIRMIIKHFKFNYRIIYSKLLQEIVIAAKDELINLLNQIPQLLPYVHRDLNDEEMRDKLYNGIWGMISQEEWDHNLFPEQLQTLHNKEILKDFLKSIWFKRYWLTAHDTLSYSKKEIEKINISNNSEKIFYSFISYIYDVHKDNNKSYYYQAVHFLEEKYEFFPDHLKGKCFLYENLYIYYVNEEKDRPNRMSFATFLELDDEHLFKYFFDHQKTKKNCLLREIKQIYQQSDVNGAHIFNIGLFSYFYSPLSAISDLKYILNRINNEKTEFHQKNYGIYEVLVRSMQLKLRLGTPDDIPLDEVLIYIQNIPIDPSSQVMEELNVMEHIREEANRFIEMKINMSIKQIMENYEEVLCKVIQFQILKRKMKKMQSWELFRSEAFNLLDDVNILRKKLYPASMNELTLLFFMSNILEEQNMITNSALLLIDEDLHELFHIEEKTIENIVLYMYKWKFSQNAVFVDNAPYLQKLLELLPHENPCRLFLQNKIELAVLLSSPEDPMEYPLSENSICPTIEDFKMILRFVSSEFLLSLNVQKLHGLIHNIEKIAYKGTVQEKEVITLHKMYQIVITIMLQKGLFREVIQYIYKIIDISNPVKDIGILYVILFIYKIAGEFNEQSRKIIFKLTAILFYEPKKLLETIEKVIKSKLTGLEQSKYLREAIEKEGKTKLNFNPDNPIFHHEFSKYKDKPEAIQLIENFRSFVKSRTQQTQSSHEYDLIFTILCNSPYLLIKFIDLEYEHLNMKTMRAFLIMVSHRELFSPIRSYQIFKRIFGGLVVVLHDHKEINGLLTLMINHNAAEEYPLPKFSRVTRKTSQFVKSANKFNKFIQHHKSRTEEKKVKLTQKRRIKFAQKIKDPTLILQEHFELEQSEADQNIEAKIKPPTKRPKINVIPFQPMKEKQRILERTVSFQQFLLNKDLLIVKEEPAILPQIQLNKKKSEASEHLLQLNKSTANKYLGVKQSMIGRLHSHKVVMGSEYDDEHSLRDDDMLDLNLSAHQLSHSGDLHQATLNQSGPESVGEKAGEGDNRFSLNIVEEDILEPDVVLYAKKKSSSPSKDNAKLKELNHLKEHLIKTYNEQRVPKFQLSALNKELQKYGDDEAKGEFFYEFVSYLYKQPIEQMNVNLKLIEQIARKHPQSKVNVFFLQPYQRIYNTHEKYGLQLDITTILPISSIFIKSKNLMDLFETVLPFIKQRLNDENVFKLSKLIALGFRKNIVEQEILFDYLKILMNSYLSLPEEELEQEYQKIRSIMHKVTNQLLADRGEELFHALYDCDRKKTLIERYIESLNSKGYPTAARDLTEKLLQ